MQRFEHDTVGTHQREYYKLLFI